LSPFTYAVKVIFVCQTASKLDERHCVVVGIKNERQTGGVDEAEEQVVINNEISTQAGKIFINLLKPSGNFTYHQV
jgi:hypothetical protein